VSEWRCQAVALVDVMEVVKAVVDVAEGHHEEDVDLTEGTVYISRYFLSKSFTF
jgi:hypothetical protein